MRSSHPPSERPRSEPEIIPPEHIESRSRVVWTSFDERGMHRVYVGRFGPFSVAIVLLMLTALAVILSLILIGTLIPLVALLIAAAVISGWWRRPFDARSNPAVARLLGRIYRSPRPAEEALKCLSIEQQRNRSAATQLKPKTLLRSSGLSNWPRPSRRVR